MQASQTKDPRSERFAAYIAARRFDPPRPLLIKAAGLVETKGEALDAGAGALNATKFLLSAGFRHVTAFDPAPASRELAEKLPADQVTFASAHFEDFAYPVGAADLVNAEFSLPFIAARSFPSIIGKLLGSVKIGGIFTGQLFGPNDSWNVPESGMNFHSRGDVEHLLRGWTILELTEEDHPGKTKLGDDKHWHIFHLIARRAG